MVYYIVYSYSPNYFYSSPTKYIEGIYEELRDANDRQLTVCGKSAQPGINGSMSGNGVVTFVNVIPKGPCHVEMFTTSPPQDSHV